MSNRLSEAVTAVLLQFLVLFNVAWSAPQTAGPALSIGDVSVTEGHAGTTDVLVAVMLTNPNTQNVTVNYQVVDGTATRGSDYTVLSISGTMTFFNGGATTQRIRVTILGDVINEGDETFLVNLSNATNATISDNQCVGTIVNDDGVVAPPNAPSNLTASPTSSTTIALAWTDNASDENGFKIERKIPQGGIANFSEIASLGNNVTSFTDTGLSAGTTYVYRVRAHRSSTQSSYSNEATAATMSSGGAPTLTIADESAIEGNAGTTDILIAVTLNNPNGQTVTVNYQVTNGTATLGSDCSVISTSGTMTFFNGGATTQRIRVTITGDATIEPDETILVNLSNATNAALPDHQGVGTIINDDGPLAPKPGNLTATATGNTTITLTWVDHPNDEEGYRLERKPNSGSYVEIATVGSNVNSFNDTGLNAGTTYVYRVRAFKGVLNSDYTNEASATTTAVPPAAPSQLTATATGASTAVLAWNDNANDEDGFKIERKPNGGSFIEIATVGGNVISFNDAGLNAGTTYVYRVRAYKAALHSNYSNEAAAVTVAQPPAAPANLMATVVGISSVSLGWTDNSNDEDGFKIERGSAASPGSFVEIATVGSNVNLYNDGGLTANTAYVYRVRAFKGLLTSSYSNEITVTTFAAGSANLALNKPITASSTYIGRPASAAVDGFADSYWRSGPVSKTTVPSWLRVDLGMAMTVGKVIVKWRENYIPKKFEVQVSNDDVNWTTVQNAIGASGAQTLTFGATTARYVRLYLTLNLKGNYRIEEFEVYSSGVTKSNADAVAETVLPQDLVLEQNYPNPFSAAGGFGNPGTRISFSLPQAARVTLKVFTLNGAEVSTLAEAPYPAGRHTVVFTPRNLPSGTYFYVLQAGAARQVRQLLLLK